MSKGDRQGPWKPATKLANLQKKMMKQKKKGRFELDF